MNHVYIIAEAGVNHNGNIDMAKKMVLAAKNAGADAIKFQTFHADSLVTETAPKAPYQKLSMKSCDTQYQMLKKLELQFADYEELKKICNQNKIDFLSTPFDLDSIEMLEQIGVDKYKMPSGEITNYPYLVKLAQTGKPIILSSGMCTIYEVEDALDVLRNNGADDLTLLHCTTDYPASYEDVNLRAMITMKDKFKINVGYSDHTKGIEISIAAAALGACVIEKHFTLDRHMEGPDHKASLEPSELANMVLAIRNTENAIGNGMKMPTQSEQKNINIVRKSIVAKCDIQAGEILNQENLTTKRPGTGISPMRWNEVIGSNAVRNFTKDEIIEI